MPIHPENAGKRPPQHRSARQVQLCAVGGGQTICCRWTIARVLDSSVATASASKSVSWRLTNRPSMPPRKVSWTAYGNSAWLSTVMTPSYPIPPPAIRPERPIGKRASSDAPVIVGRAFFILTGCFPYPRRAVAPRRSDPQWIENLPLGAPPRFNGPCPAANSGGRHFCL
jgi:hypothetical protein